MAPEPIYVGPRAFTGPLTLQLAPAVLQMAAAELEEAIRGTSAGQTVVMNLTALGKVDTSALTVLLALTRQAQQSGIQLVWSSMPPALLELAKLSSVDALLPTA